MTHFLEKAELRIPFCSALAWRLFLALERQADRTDEAPENVGDPGINEMLCRSSVLPSRSRGLSLLFGLSLLSPPDLLKCLSVKPTQVLNLRDEGEEKKQLQVNYSLLRLELFTCSYRQRLWLVQWIIAVTCHNSRSSL